MAGFNRTLRTLVDSYVPSAARTTHPTFDNIEAVTATGIVFYIDLTAFTGTNITFTVVSVDPVSGNIESPVLASAALASADTVRLVIAPGAATASNAALGTVCPRFMRVVPSGTITSATYSIAYELID